MEIQQRIFDSGRCVFIILVSNVHILISIGSELLYGHGFTDVGRPLAPYDPSSDNEGATQNTAERRLGTRPNGPRPHAPTEECDSSDYLENETPFDGFGDDSAK